MAWRRIVIRPDSIIRWWSLAQLDCPEGFARIYDSPDIRGIDFNSLVAISDGSEHVRIEEMATLGGGLIRASVDRPTLFQDIGHHYEGVIDRWLAYAATLDDDDLGTKSNQELQALLAGFTSLYKEFSPILFVPFIVERRYATEYPALLDRLATRVLEEAQRLAESNELRLLAHAGSIQVATSTAMLKDDLRAMLEYSPRRTIAEQKEIAVQRLAAQIEADSDGNSLFTKDLAPQYVTFASDLPQLGSMLEAVHEEFKWLGHWGYPPKFQDSTIDDLLADIHARIQRGAVVALEETLARDDRARDDHYALLKLGELDSADTQLVEDINYYNYLRTARMEAKIRAQYLSIPLFSEIQRRGDVAGVLAPFDVYLMVPPEIDLFLSDGTVPKNLAERRTGWTLVTNAQRGEWTVLTGAGKREFEDGFYGVIDWRENARGLHNPTTPFVGGKGAGLFKLVEAGCEVPPFLVVTTEAFRRTMEASSLQDRLRAAVNGYADSSAKAAVAKHCQALIRQAELPPGTAKAIGDVIPQLGPHLLAVRSSATVEDAEDASWAGRFDSVLDVAPGDVAEAIKTVWASLFTERSLDYAVAHGVDLAGIPMAVVVQAMVTADTSGVMNTVLNADSADIVEIEVAFGYGSSVVDGEITPDRYLVDMNAGTIIDRHIAPQERMLTAGGWTAVERERVNAPKIADEIVLELARTGKKIERDLGGPQDIEFAIQDGQIAIVQSRPLTGLATTAAAPSASGGNVPAGARLVASGLKGKTATVLRGRCQVLMNLAEARDFVDGNILVLVGATPAWDSVIFRAGALITNDGGATSHAIRVANERRIPVVVGTTSATETIKDGAELAVDTSSDPFKGRVYLV